MTAARKIVATVFASDKPAQAHWRRIGQPQHPDYVVRWDRGNLDTATSHCATFKQAKQEARALVKEGRAWAEVLRYWEDGQRIRPSLLVSYEVEYESGSAIR